MASLGLQLEGASTNLYAEARNFAGGDPWTNVAILAPVHDQEVGPSGYPTAAVIGTTGNEPHYITSFHPSNTSVTNAYRCVVKPHGYIWLQIAASWGYTTSDYVNINLSTGEFGASSSGQYRGPVTVNMLDNGWVEVLWSHEVTNALSDGNARYSIVPLASDVASRQPSTVMDGVSGILLDSMQAEEALFSSSQIQSIGTQKTRAATKLTRAFSTIPELDGAITGPVSFQLIYEVTAKVENWPSFGRAFELNTADTQDSVRVFRSNTPALAVSLTVGGVQGSSNELLPTTDSGGIVDLRVSYGPTLDLNMYINGVLAQDTGYTPFGNPLTIMALMCRSTGTSNSFGIVKRVSVWPYELTRDELENLPGVPSGKPIVGIEARLTAYDANVTVPNGVRNKTYQWFRDGTAVGTGRFYDHYDAGSYHVEMSFTDGNGNPHGPVASDPVTVAISHMNMASNTAGDGSAGSPFSWAQVQTTPVAGMTYLIHADADKTDSHPTFVGAAGTQYNHIVLKNAQGETPRFRRTETGQMTAGVQLDGCSYLSVRGLTLDGFVRDYDTCRLLDGVLMHNPTSNITIEAMTIERIRTDGVVARSSANAANVIVRDCYIAECGRVTDATTEGGGITAVPTSSNWLIEGNRVSDAAHHPIYSRANNTVIRNNIVTNFFGTNNDGEKTCIRPGGEVSYRCISVTECTENVIENNWFSRSGMAFASTTYSDSLQHTAGSCIIRDNIFSDAKGRHVGFKNYDNHACTDNRFYHNTLYDTDGSGVKFEAFGTGVGVTNNRVQNNIVYMHNQDTTHCGAPNEGNTFYVHPNVANAGDIFNGNAFVDNLVAMNAQGTGQTVMADNIEKSFTDYTTSHPNDVSGNIEAVPNFTVNPPVDVPDFALQDGSPGKGVATALTRAVGTGHFSNTLTVVDGNMFFDGHGIVDGDVINLAGTTARIIAKTGNVLELDRQMRWAHDDPITLYADMGRGSKQNDIGVPIIGS